MKRMYKTAAAVMCLVLLVCLMAGCASTEKAGNASTEKAGSASTEDKLVGKWTRWGEEIITFYEDGTFVEDEYGTGYWTILSDNTLKATSFYGETSTITIAEITDDSVVFENGVEWKRVK